MVNSSLEGFFVLYYFGFFVCFWFFEGVNQKKCVKDPKINFDKDYGSTEYMTNTSTFDSMQI